MEKKEKLDLIKKLGYQPYPPNSLKKTDIKKILDGFQKFLLKKKRFWIAGRVIAIREHGKITFVDLKDFTGRIQVIVKDENVKKYNDFIKIIDIGDFFSFYGYPFLPESKEKSILAFKWQILSKSLKNFPKEYYKVRDEELLVRCPYLKTIFYDEEKETFYYRFRLIEELRKILWKEGFLEVETPILQTHYGGALARPFVTYLEALKEPLYLRIAPELYLKKLIVGGFEKIFEIGKNFRNEGIDREHNPEFTMMELYWAYQDQEGLMNFTQKIIQKLVKTYTKWRGQKGLSLEFKGRKINLEGKWKRIEFVKLIKNYTGLDYFENDLKDFINFAKEKKIEFNPKLINKGKIVDEIFKKLIRPNLWEPIFLIDHPKEISPLAKENPKDPRLTLRFQLYLGGYEVANAYAELNDPIDQKERFLAQAEELKRGDVEAHPYDETFIEALEYGMPPTAGLGIGLDRLFSIILNKESIKDVIYFPFVKKQ